MRGSRIVWPKQIRRGQTSPTRSESVHPLVVKSWLGLPFSFFLLYPSLILSLAGHCLHGHDLYIVSTCVHSSPRIDFPPLFIVSTVIFTTLSSLAHFLSLSLALSVSIPVLFLLSHPYIFIFNFSFAQSLFSSWLLCSSPCCLKLGFLWVVRFSLTQ